VVLIGVLAGQIGEPFPGRSPFAPTMAGFAAAMAAAVAPHRSGSSIGASLALAAGAFLVACFVGVWLTHWIGVGSLVRRQPANPAAIGWRRDLTVCLLGIGVGSFLGAFLGHR
jgi:hypothetical protein